MRMVRVRAYSDTDGNVTPWFDEIFSDIQDFEPSSWSSRELALALDSLERYRWYTERLSTETYLYEYVGW